MTPTTPHQQVGYGDEALGTDGDLAPGPPLTTITYRIDGRTCQRAPSEPPGIQQPPRPPVPVAALPHEP